MLGGLVPQGAGLRHDYAWEFLRGVNLAKVLRKQRVALIEFGVAEGNGLLALERLAQGDLPNLWREGWCAMDREKLERLKKARLKKARLKIHGLRDE